MRERKRLAWSKPAVLPLGGLAVARGSDGVGIDSTHKCSHGFSVSQVCGNGSSANVQQCKRGNVPPSGSCASGNQGS
jgi:hypothetical protein